ncbi:MAG: hypothetical protein Q9217_003935 [Psora testacea]
MATYHVSRQGRPSGLSPDSRKFKVDNVPLTGTSSLRLTRLQAASSVSRAMTNTDWRQKDERQQIAFDAPYMPSPNHQGLNANRCSVMTRQVCSVGMIIRAAVHEQDFNDAPAWAATEADTHSVASKLGQIYSKVRWMIVVATFENHYLTVPLYTHNGKGLENKSEKARSEYVSIRDDRHGGSFHNLSHHCELEVEMNRGTTVLHRKTIAHLTAPVTRKYDLLVEQQGNLEQGSKRLLIKLWRECTMGMKSI